MVRGRVSEAGEEEWGKGGERERSGGREKVSEQEEGERERKREGDRVG